MNSLDIDCVFIKGPMIAGVIPAHFEEADDKNELGFDIFWAPQLFKGDIRRKEELIALRYLCADFDNITFEELKSRFLFMISPSLIVKTRSGFHCYWKLIENVPFTNAVDLEYKKLIETALVPIGADPNAKDVCRMLRLPGSRYWADSKNNRYDVETIKCDIIFENGKSYYWDDLKRLLPKPYARPQPTPNIKTETNGAIHSSFWEKANQYPAEQALPILSGTDWVNGQVFKIETQGKLKRVLVNGKASNAWIDESGRIGSLHKGSGGLPVAGTIVNFLTFYGHDMKTISEIFKEVLKING